jgi:hypothetical protein
MKPDRGLAMECFDWLGEILSFERIGSIVLGFFILEIMFHVLFVLGCKEFIVKVMDFGKSCLKDDILYIFG